MTIPGRGDLAPRRRYRSGRRRWPRVLLALVVLAGLGAAGWFGWQQLHDDDGTATLRTAPPPCASPSPTASAPPGVTHPVRVLNGNLRPGQAAQAARQLHRRFDVTVAKVGNAARFVRGRSVVRHPAALAAEADRLAAMVVPPARLEPAGAGRRLELELGTRFERVATRAEYRAAAATTATPAPPASPTAAAAGATPCR